jgi:hypothetical protein
MMEDPVLVNTPNGGGLHEASDTGTQNKGSDVFTGKPERIYRVVVELLITNLRLPKKTTRLLLAWPIPTRRQLMGKSLA